MDNITTKYIKSGYSEIEEPIILDETPTTRTVLKCALTPKGVRGKLWRQKKDADKTFKEVNEIDFRKEDCNYGVEIDIPSEGLKTLARDLYTFFKIRKEEGVEFGENKYITGKESEYIKVTDKNKAEVIKELIEKGFSEDYLNKLSELEPSIIEKVTKAKIQERREDDLTNFDLSLLLENEESYWQDFFENKKWIFGYGLNHQILKEIQSQPNYGGTSVNGKGGQRGDYLTTTSGAYKYTVLVEIKTPFTPLTNGIKPHHTGAWSLSTDLTNAITQLQANIDTWNKEGSNQEENIDNLHQKQIYTIVPKGILIIGNQAELSDPIQRKTFERFRQNITGVEIITFDELYERAKFIVNEE